MEESPIDSAMVAKEWSEQDNLQNSLDVRAKRSTDVAGRHCKIQGKISWLLTLWIFPGSLADCAIVDFQRDFVMELKFVSFQWNLMKPVTRCQIIEQVIVSSHLGAEKKM